MFRRLPPPPVIDQRLKYRAQIHLAKDPEAIIEIELFADLAPATVNNFVFLVEEGYYDGLEFHRVIPDFVVQTGKRPERLGYAIDDEFHPELRHDAPGMAGIAYPAGQSRGTDSGEFYITLNPAPHLDAFEPDGTPKNCQDDEVYCRTVFGRVISGMVWVDATSPGGHPDAIQRGDIIRTIEIATEARPGRHDAHVFDTLYVDVAAWDREGTAVWMVSYPYLKGAFWFENELYLPADTRIRLITESLDGHFRTLSGPEPFGHIDVHRPGHVDFMTPEELFSVVRDDRDNELKVYVLPAERFEHIAMSGYGCTAWGGATGPRVTIGAVRDCVTLLDSKDALTAGKPELLNWGFDVPFFEWDGVIRGETGYSREDGRFYAALRVMGLDLRGRGLVGSFPNELGSLPFLRHIRLRGNDLTGCVPASLRQAEVEPVGLPYCSD